MTGVKDRATNRVHAQVVPFTDTETLRGFVCGHAAAGATVHTDETRAYRGMLEFDHEAVNDSAGEYVCGMPHTNGMESFWSMLKRAHKGTFRKISPKQLQRYVNEFVGRHNVREVDTLDQMGEVATGMAGKRLRHADLIVNNGLPSGART